MSLRNNRKVTGEYTILNYKTALMYNITIYTKFSVKF